MEAKELLIVVNKDSFFLSHRKAVALAAREAGWRVIVVACGSGREGEILKAGLEFIPLPINTVGVDVMDEVRTVRFLARLYRQHSGAVVHHVGMKLIMMGNLAVQLAGGVRGVVDAVSGMGRMFMNPDSMKCKLLMRGLAMVYNARYQKRTIIFQNHDDEREFEKARLLRCSGRAFIKGSGVDLEEFSFREQRENGVKRVIFTGRLLRSKGVLDLVKSAEILRSRHEEDTEFIICGGSAGEADAISAEELAGMCDGKYISYLGERRDVAELLKSATLMAFPSYYREGVPRSLIEASAVGLPIVTTDSVGCRDTIGNPPNGLLVEPQSPAKLAEAIHRLLSDSALCRRMGRESRRIAERDYDIQAVIDAHLRIYEMF